MLVGHCINDLCSLPVKGRNSFPVSSGGIGTDDILRSYVGLLAIGQSDFEAVTNRKEDDYFRQAMGIGRVPSAATLRQRLDEVAPELLAVADACSVEFLKKARVPITPPETGHVPLDCDVFGMDNSKTKKEGVSRIYNGKDGQFGAGQQREAGGCGSRWRPGKEIPGALSLRKMSAGKWRFVKVRHAGML